MVETNILVLFLLVADSKMSSAQRCPCANAQNPSEYATLNGKKDFPHTIKLKILTWKDYPVLSRLVNCNHKGLYKAEAGESELG